MYPVIIYNCSWQAYKVKQNLMIIIPDTDDNKKLIIN
jgi:hypothetical protein